MYIGISHKLAVSKKIQHTVNLWIQHLFTNTVSVFDKV